MEIEIKFQARPGLSIVPKIADGQLVWIRGFNGVGKTLAATMLVIASGGHRFERIREFESLKEALKYVDITVRINEKTDFAVKLTPGRWRLLEETMMIDSATLGQFYQKGKEITAEEFQRNFRAKIVKGNETLSTQIQEMISRNIAIFREWEDKAHLSLESYGDFVKELFTRLQIDRLKILGEKESKIEELEKQIFDFKSQMKEHEDVVQSLLALKEIDDKIEFTKKYDMKSLQENLQRTNNELENLGDHTRQLREKRDSLRSSIRQEIVSRKQRYDYLLRQSESLEGRIRNSKMDLFNALRDLEIAIKFTELMPERVEGAVNEKKGEFRKAEDNLKKQKEDIFIKRELHETTTHIKGILISEQEKLFGEVIAEGFLEAISQKIELTVDELRELVENRESIVQEQLASANIDEINAKLKQLNNLIKQSESVLKVNKKLIDQNNDVKLFRREIKKFEEMGGDKTEPISREIKKLEDKIEETQFKIFEHRRAREGIRNRIDQIRVMPSLESLYEQREEVFGSLTQKFPFGKSTKITSDFIKTQQQATKTLEYKLAEIIDFQRRLKKDVGAILKAIDRAVMDAVKSDELNFLFESIEEEIPAARKLEIVKDRLDAFINYTDRDILGNIEDIHIALEQMLKFQREKEAIEEYKAPHIGEALEKIFNNEFLRIYSKKDFMTHVFRGFEEIVGFDLKNNEISLRDQEGDISNRLISAFSSGEKAFTFALAMTSLFSREVASYKVLFLDEFGALLDFVKEDVLLQELEKEVFRKGKINKVVILLPVKLDIRKQISELSRTRQFVSSEEKQRIQSTIDYLSSQAESLEKDGYYQYETPIS